MTELRDLREDPDVIRIGREKELDELIARARSFPGASTLDPESLIDVPVARISHPGRAPVIPAGNRARRPAASTLGSPPGMRHNWVPIGPRNVAGRMRAIACADPTVANPQTWYAASAGGGVWKTTNAGRRWTPLWHEQPCLELGAIAVAPSNPQRVYVATGEAAGASHIAVRGFGVFVSTDAGATWDNFGAGAPNPVHRNGFDAIAVDPAAELHCWAVGPDGAFRTTDGGQHWERFDAGVHYTDVAFGGGRLFLVRGTSRAGEGAIVRLAAPAASPADVTAALAAAASTSVVVAARPAHLPWPAAGKIAISPSSPATAYVRWAGEDDRHLGVFRTTNANAAQASGITWTRLADHPHFRDDGQGTYNLCIAVDPADPARVATGMVYVHVSTNATAAQGRDVRWRRVMGWELHDEGLRGHHADQHHLVIAGNPSELWVGHDGGVARCANWFTGGTVDHGLRFRPDPVRPVPAGAVRWERRDLGITGAQLYDLAQSPLVAPVVAGGLQDNGTYLRSGGLTWRPIFGADGGFCAFDPDDPYRLYISYYAGLAALQFPALLDRHFADGARDNDAISFRFLEEDVNDDAPFVPETARHPNRTGRTLHARRGRLYGMTPGAGERFHIEPLGRSFELRVFAPPVPAAPPPPPPAGPTEIVVADTPGARRLGLVPGHVLRRDRTAIVLRSRFPAPYRLTEGDQLQLTVNGTALPAVAFAAAAGIDPAAVSVADVLNLVGAALPDQADVRASVWDTASAVQLVTRGSGVAETIRLGGDALDPLPDGLARLGLNRGTYAGDAGRGASVLLGYAGDEDADRLLNRDFSGAVRTLEVTVNGGTARSVRLEPPAFPDPARITAGQLATALATALAADPVDVHPVPTLSWLELRGDPNTRVVLSDTAAARFGTGTRGTRVVRLGVPNLRLRHQGRGRRNRSSVDLAPEPPGGAALQLVISDGTNATAPLRFTEGAGGNVAALRSATVEELHRAVAAHLAGSAVRVRAELVVFPLPGAVSELCFSPADDDEAWAGTPDGSVFVTRDDGSTWTDVTDAAMRLADRQVEAIVLDPTDRQRVVVGLSGEAGVAADPGFVFRSADGGTRWEMVGHRVVAGKAEGIAVGGLPIGVNALELDPADPSVVFAGTDAGVFRSPDRGTTWAPFGDGLPNAPVVDLTAEPHGRLLRATLWTRGVHERRLDPAAPDDARLLIRATELDDGRRPARLGPALGLAAPEPLPLRSPDIKVVRRRPDVGADADLDGVAFDIDIPDDDVVVPGTAAEVMVQVANTGGLTIPAATPPPPDQHVRVVALWAPAGGAVPPLPPDVWTRLAAGPLAGTIGGWTVLGDDRVPRPVAPGDTAIRSFAVNWPEPELAGVARVGVLALATAAADALTGGPTDVAALVAVERRAAYKEVPVRAAEDDRTMLLVSTDGRDIAVEQAAPPAGTGVADRLGFAAGDLGVGGRSRLAAPAGSATYDLSVAAPAPGPAIVVRSAAPLTADLALLPTADEADDPTSVAPSEVAAMINRRASVLALPIEASAPPVGFAISGRDGVTVRVTGGAAAGRLGLAVAAHAAFMQSNQTVAWFDLTGAAALNLEVRLPGAAPTNVAVAVDLAPENFSDPAVADPNQIVRVIRDALRDAELGEVVRVFATGGLSVRGRGQALVSVSGAAAAAGVLNLPAAADNVVVAASPSVDLSAGPNLHVEVTPRAIVRLDGDPADIPDLAHAAPADVRRAVNLGCELASVPIRAEVPVVDLRVTGLVASSTPVAAADQAGLFSLRRALGAGRLEVGVANRLYLRVAHAGNIRAAPARLRLFRVEAADPDDTVAVTEVGSATPALEPGASHIEELTWDPEGSAPRVQAVLAVADDDRPGRALDVPATFPSTADLSAFATRPSVALRSFDVVEP